MGQSGGLFKENQDQAIGKRTFKQIYNWDHNFNFYNGKYRKWKRFAFLRNQKLYDIVFSTKWGHK